MQGEKGDAAVLLLASADQNGRKLLLTQRALHLNTHRGEVSFPGGMWEPDDLSLADTALRETHEEVGIAPCDVQLVGELPVGYTRAGVRVKPYIGQVAADINTTMNLSELRAIFWVPESYLGKDQRVRTDVFTFADREVWAPAYRFGDYEIWGFTSRVMLQFMDVYWGVRLPRESSAPTIRHRPQG